MNVLKITDPKINEKKRRGGGRAIGLPHWSIVRFLTFDWQISGGGGMGLSHWSIVRLLTFDLQLKGRGESGFLPSASTGFYCMCVFLKGNCFLMMFPFHVIVPALLQKKLTRLNFEEYFHF